MTWRQRSTPIHTIALGRKNHLFAGSDGGAEHWAILASLIATCKINGVDPQNYLADVLTRIVDRHPMSRLDEFLPFAYVKPEPEKRYLRMPGNFPSSKAFKALRDIVEDDPS